MTTFLKILLSPFSLIYRLVTGFRNHLYNIGHKRSHQFSVLTIGVGNLKVGGVGKTPFSEYLMKSFLENSKKVAYLSRGYGRQSKGLLGVLPSSEAKKVGDEALQVAIKFADARVFVCEDRVMAIPEILHTHPEVNTIVLDDVYQHRRITPHVNLLLTAYHDLFVNDSILPGGRLRESRNGAKRASAVVVTKTPVNTSETEKKEVIKSLTSYLSDGVPVFFAYSKYKDLKQVIGEKELSSNVITVCALANNDVFVEEVNSARTVKKSFNFRDHHYFKPKEIEEIITFALNNKLDQVVTTEKDWQRLKQYKKDFTLSGIKVAVLPFYFRLENEELLWELIKHEESKI